MSKEIEIKIFEIDKEKIEEKIVSLGGIKKHDIEVETRYYDIEPEAAYGEKRKFLRIRRKWNVYKFTYKWLSIQENMQVNDEIDVQIESPDNLREILPKIWHPEYDHVKKQRTTYELWNIIFDIDTYDLFPTFMEIEAPSIKLVKEWTSKLWLDSYPQSWDGYPKIKTIWYDTFITELKKKQWII